MCGILGGFNFNESYSFRNMSSLHKRGPDFQGTWHSGNVFLGLSRLSIIDPEYHGHQPMENNSYLIAYNGEVYNFMELKNELKNKGVQFKSTSDTKVVLEAITHYGLDIVKQFRGFWAIALYDKKEKQLILCRDHFGIKPLYYYHNNDSLCFSSMIKTIRQNSEGSFELDYEALSEYVRYQFTFDNKTFFKQVKKVLPGEFIFYSTKTYTITRKKYFDYNELTEKKSEEVSLESIRETIINGIKESTLSDVPITTFCSGGLDSSYITSIVKPEVAYHCNFSDPECNETKYAKDLIEFINGPRLMVINADEKFDVIEKLSSIVNDFDELTIGSVIFPMDDILRAIHKRYKVVLS